MKKNIYTPSKEIELIFVLCRMAFSGVASLNLIELLRSAKWKNSCTLKKFKLLEQQYDKDFPLATAIQQKYMVQTRKKIELMLGVNQ